MKVLLLFPLVILANILSIQGSPIPASVNPSLPSITYDTLVGYFDPKYKDGHATEEIPDSDMAESVPGPISGPLMTYTAYRLVRSMFDDQDDPNSMMYYSPFRVVRRVANGMSNVGKTFMSTFATEFQKSYDALSTGVKERMGGILPISATTDADEAASSWGSDDANVETLGKVAMNKPHPHRASFSESNWMEGI